MTPAISIHLMCSEIVCLTWDEVIRIGLRTTTKEEVADPEGGTGREKKGNNNENNTIARR
jgi:hypothetical protein